MGEEKGKRMEMVDRGDMEERRGQCNVTFPLFPSLHNHPQHSGAIHLVSHHNFRYGPTLEKANTKTVRSN